jgi:hypothetical protein
VVRAKPATIAVAVGAIAGLTGCQILGPVSISQGRISYNRVIEETSKEQVFLNVVRVYKHAPTLFMDVSEVDAQVLIQGTATGGRANIGAHAGTSGGSLAGSTESVLGSFEYQEAPTIRYFPLAGQPLVQQIATPITVDSLSNLSDSNWPLASILTFAANNLTLGYEDYFSALNAIIELDEYGALVLAARRSDWTNRADGGGSKPPERKSGPTSRADTSSSNPPAGPNDALVLYLEPEHPLARGREEATAKRRRILHLWIRLLRVYDGTQPPAGVRDLNERELADLNTKVDRMDEGALEKQFLALRNWIELRTAPIPPAPSSPPTLGPHRSAEQQMPQGQSFRKVAPLLRTRSALGILKFSTELQSPPIAFVTPEVYDSTRNHYWNQKEFWDFNDPTFYISVACDDASAGRPNCSGNPTLDWKGTFDTPPPVNYFDLYTLRHEDFTGDFGKLTEERALGHSRRYILVVVTEYPPLDAYVSISYSGKWYYIAGDDKTSQVNFTLLAQFLTMQAVPPTNAPLTPTISVGRPGG